MVDRNAVPLFDGCRNRRELHAWHDRQPSSSGTDSTFGTTTQPKMIGPYETHVPQCRIHDPRTTEVARRVAIMVESHLPSISVEHVGSTSVAGCAGKGVVDLMVIYPDGQLENVRNVLDGLGFQRQTGRDPFPEDRPMRIGSIELDGTRFLLQAHVIVASSPEVMEFRGFRDRLRRDPDLVRAYEAEKKAIIASGVTDSVDYAIRKGEFVRKILDAIGCEGTTD